ncbi:MAG: hypothetical protein EHM56_10140 [Chloroflexi bacterium]|nr:MAG: hypothetical protein EHM56_10140 [Chloroflexota bacterium]
MEWVRSWPLDPLTQIVLRDVVLRGLLRAVVNLCIPRRFVVKWGRVESEQTVFLKTIIPSRKATKQYLKGGSDE